MYPNPKPKPPMPGGEYTHVSDPGTPPLPPGTKVVQLIPVGDGGPGTPLPPLDRRKRKAAADRAELRALRRWMSDVVAELRGEIERLKAEAYNPEPRSTFEEF